MVSATHIYKTYAKHTLPFSFQFLVLNPISCQKAADTTLGKNADHGIGV